jgi:hypothetical protein
MTGFTLTRRTLEYSRDMAGFAFYPGMLACQRKTGLKMVKSLAARQCLRQWQRKYDHQGHQQPGTPAPPMHSITCMPISFLYAHRFNP